MVARIASIAPQNVSGASISQASSQKRVQAGDTRNLSATSPQNVQNPAPVQSNPYARIGNSSALIQAQASQSRPLTPEPLPGAVEISAFKMEKPEIEGVRDLARQAREMSLHDELTLKRLQKDHAATVLHENAHASAAGPYRGAKTYMYRIGPDGQMYAIHGRVRMDVSPMATPEATVRKMQMLIKAARAPRDPSPGDYAAIGVMKMIMNNAQSQLRAAEVGEMRQQMLERDPAFNLERDPVLPSNILAGAQAYGKQATPPPPPPPPAPAAVKPQQEQPTESDRLPRGGVFA